MNSPTPNGQTSMPVATELDPDSLLLIVVGAHLYAEWFDRPMADELTECVRDWQVRSLVEGERQLLPLTCTDLWYLNNSDLHHQSAISIGSPSINAASAYLGTRLPTALVIEETLRIQMDVEHIDRQVCLWGVDHRTTRSAVELFVQRFLSSFLYDAHGLNPACSA